jgi:hypothetical protein
MQEFFGEYINIITGLSIGTIAMVGWRILSFFKKDKYVLPFVNIAQTKAIEFLGKTNYHALIDIVKDVNIKDIPSAIKGLIDKVDNLESLLKILLANQVNLGVYNDNPELKEKLENLL